MMRILLTYVIPLVLPAVLYFLWVYEARRRAQVAGKAVPGEISTPWLLLAAAGVVLLALTLGTVALVSRSEPGGRYEPPRIQDGRIVPGQAFPD